MNKRIATFQWAQLLVLSAVHFTADMFGNILPSILPAVRSEFAFRASIGFFVLVALTITANGVQIATGHLRAGNARPLFLHLGLILAVCVCLLPALPRTPLGISGLIFLAGISGAGIAVVHPEGLRAVHTITRIPPAISTAVFMTGGFLGFALGGIISTALVSRFGLPGLYPLLLCPVLAILMIVLLRIRLAVETTPDQTTEQTPTQNNHPAFHLIMIMAIPAAISTTLFALLLPTRLEELGFELTFGGFSATMFGLGGVLGSLLWAAIAHRKGELPCSTLAYLLAGPFALAYLLLMDKSGAVWLIFATGFFAFAAYILLITVARYSPGPNLGFRMGWLVGGTWLFANIIFLALAPIAARFGTNLVMQYVPFGYLLSALFGIYIIKKTGARPAQD